MCAAAAVVVLLVISAAAAPAVAFSGILGESTRDSGGGGALPSRTPNKRVRIRLGSAKSCVDLFDPKTGTEVVLLGCLHGSLSSSIDVKKILRGEEGEGETETEAGRRRRRLPDAVVLELCDARFRDIESGKDGVVENYGGAEFWEDFGNFWTGAVWPAFEERGPVVALVKLLLGSTSLLQTNLSGIRSGLEFEVAMDIIDRNNGKPKQNDDDKDNENESDGVRQIEVVLGDRDFEVTMERLGDLLSVSLQMIADGGNPLDNISRANKLLFDAVLGDPSLPEGSQACMPEVLVRNSQARADLGRLLALPAAVAAIAALSLAWILRGFEPDPYDTMLFSGLWTADGAERASILLDLLLNSLADIAVFALGYVLVALPASKVIISERDQILAKTILTEATGGGRGPDRKEDDDNNIRSLNAQRGESSLVTGLKAQPSKRIVVAILGLLHVNGVARQLLDCGYSSRQ